MESKMSKATVKPTGYELFQARASEAFYYGQRLVDFWFGPRCVVFEPTCEVCRRWRLLDQLVQNPFEDSAS